MEANTKTKMPAQGVIYALLAALFFGLTTPLAKGLIEQSRLDPVLLAGLFYFGSSLGLSVFLLVSAGRGKRQEAPLAKSDWKWLLGATVCGGMVAPVLLMLGLVSLKATTASLLLNLEGVFTALLAWLVFKENCDRRIVLGMFAIVGGGILLSMDSGETLEFSRGAWLVTGACLAWGIDNNLTRKVANADAVKTAWFKGLLAGTVNIALAIFYKGALLPPPATLAWALSIGFIGYGVSLVLFVLALRHIATARTGAYFATAPFVGAVLSIVILHESVGLLFLGAALLMALGLWLHLTEVHEHSHKHEAIEHDHVHTHGDDEHHDHEHEFGFQVEAGAKVKHSHVHRHEALEHSHAHFPDTHHLHQH